MMERERQQNDSLVNGYYRQDWPVRRRGFSRYDWSLRRPALRCPSQRRSAARVAKSSRLQQEFASFSLSLSYILRACALVCACYAVAPMFGLYSGPRSQSSVGATAAGHLQLDRVAQHVDIGMATERSATTPLKDAQIQDSRRAVERQPDFVVRDPEASAVDDGPCVGGVRRPHVVRHFLGLVRSFPQQCPVPLENRDRLWVCPVPSGGAHRSQRPWSSRSGGSGSSNRSSRSNRSSSGGGGGSSSHIPISAVIHSTNGSKFRGHDGDMTAEAVSARSLSSLAMRAISSC